ncbi:MAG: GTPase Der [Fimbriimonadaceae bacterium]|nr:GTPase Der [Fimbriimonadaceae bacterium]
MSAKIPTVVIVGRPNVGKSTFFNRLVGKRVAVVEDQPGVTRDRLYAEATWKKRKFTVVDTGGILFSDDDPLIEQIRTQAQVALAEADVILFLVDGGEGLRPDDMELANHLRGVKKPLYIVVNKADNPNRAAMAPEFYSLGLGEVFPISSIHGRGVSDLLDEVVNEFPVAAEEDDLSEEIRLAIVGRPNVGKSSMLNAFTGEVRSIVSDIPGTTRDAIDTLIQYKGDTFRLIDTAGLRRRGKIQGTVEYYMAMRASQAIERCHCALIVVDGDEGLTDGDKRIAKMAHDQGRACVIAVNKWDLVEPPDGEPRKNSGAKKDFVAQFRREFPELAYAEICFTSAKETAGLEPVLDTVLKALESWNFRISTGRLNRLIQEACDRRPYTTKGKALRIYYSTQVAARPPTFVVFCNDPDILHFSYQRYLENQLRKEFKLEGTPIRLTARSSRDRD